MFTHYKQQGGKEMSELNDYTLETYELNEIIDFIDDAGEGSLSAHEFEYADLYES